jgi:hypothetical protein
VTTDKQRHTSVLGGTVATIVVPEEANLSCKMCGEPFTGQAIRADWEDHTVVAFECFFHDREEVSREDR